jgi:branched-chain amino acid transport system ATP-binding protein/urea transport system ATP-binding protein
MLMLRGVKSGYADAGLVLDGIDLDVGDSEAVALMGRNGMGKTTLLRTIAGHLAPQAGKVLFDQRDITAAAPFVVSNAGVAYVPQGREIFSDFTVEENLLLGVIGKYGMAARVPQSVYERFPLLRERRTQRAGSMSGGEQQQLAIARAIVSQPRLLLLDEPSEGIQPSLVQAIGQLIAQIVHADRMSVLLVEQNADLVLAVTTRCVFIENGRIAAQAPTTQLRANTALFDQYLSV